MRFLIGSVVVLVSGIVIFAVSPDTRTLEQQMDDVLECVRELLASGLPDQGFPSFNPLELSSSSVDLSALGVDGLSGSVTVEDLHLAGVPDFKQSNINATIGAIPPGYTIQLTLTFPVTSVKTKYDIDVSYSPSNRHVYGAGEFALEAVNAIADLDLAITFLSGIAISKFELWVCLEGLNSFSLTGLYNDDECSAQLVETVLADPSGVVASYAQAIHDIASDVVISAVDNGALEGDGLLPAIMHRCTNISRTEIL
ncbi:hypothetical protein Trydic_g21637 [Trypoxylus dichotomus]